MLKQMMPGFRIALALTILTGLLYPCIVTALCQWFFPRQANGSLMEENGRVFGSRLIGQGFEGPEYAHPRPSAAGKHGYDASASGGSNLGPTSRKLFLLIKADVEKFRKENPDFHGAIPIDMVTRSGSGLDPHISPASAKAQAARIAKARKVSIGQVNAFIDRYTESSAWGFLGDARINVLMLNLALDRNFPSSGTRLGGNELDFYEQIPPKNAR